MSGLEDMAPTFTRDGELVDPLVDRAVRAHWAELHRRLALWIQAHPDPLDPTTHLAFEGDESAVGRIIPRAEAVAFFRAHANPILRTLGDNLSQLPPVPLGSIDIIVSTPQAMRLARVTPVLGQVS